MKAPTPAQAAAIRLGMKMKPDRVHEQPTPVEQRYGDRHRNRNRGNRTPWNAKWC